ncbi:Ribonuclease H-like domain containing protein [Trema orientale]|uniref:Ribonuclease H-like domain containing protein n=1 Tax=Trema orientale TaxID=63057 RepID=A0A2P5EP22_TREOI|nr:Ribonuclease H-like domain containing protein [Trema orientale]
MFASPADILISYSMIAEVAFLEVFCVLLWAIWNRRNDVLHNQNSKEAAALLDWVQSFLFEFQDGLKIVNVYSICQGRNLVKWCKPSSGSLKLNVDAAVIKDSGVIGVGGAIRDLEGLVLACWSLQLVGYFDIVTSELLAIREGVRLAVEFGCPLASIESDSLSAVQAISSPSPCFAGASIVNDILFFNF